MGDEAVPHPHPFSFVYGPAFTYLCIISHQCNAPESYFKENLGIQDISMHQKASNIVNSLLPAYATSVKCLGQYGVITMMISSAAILIGQKFLNY